MSALASTLRLARSWPQLRPNRASVTGCLSARWKHHRRCNMDIETLVEQLRAQRYKDLAVIKTPFQHDPELLVVASSFNERHLDASTESLNKFYKNDIKDRNAAFAKISLSPGWNVLDFDSIVVHLMLPETRERYDIEQLWCVGEEYDEQINHPKEDPQAVNYRYFIEKMKEEEDKVRQSELQEEKDLYN